MVIDVRVVARAGSGRALLVDDCSRVPVARPFLASTVTSRDGVRRRAPAAFARGCGAHRLPVAAYLRIWQRQFIILILHLPSPPSPYQSSMSCCCSDSATPHVPISRIFHDSFCVSKFVRCKLMVLCEILRVEGGEGVRKLMAFDANRVTSM